MGRSCARREVARRRGKRLRRACERRQLPTRREAAPHGTHLPHKGGKARTLRERVHEDGHTGVGSDIAEARERCLNQREWQALVEPADAALAPQRTQGLKRGAAVFVLVVDCRAHPHEREHLHDGGSRAGRAAAERGAPRLAQNRRHVHRHRYLGRARDNRSCVNHCERHASGWPVAQGAAGSCIGR